MEKIKKFFANKMVITGLIIAVILFVLYSNKDKIKAWFEPDAASDKPKEGNNDKPDKYKPTTQHHQQQTHQPQHLQLQIILKRLSTKVARCKVTRLKFCKKS